ncbi:hypothetical protein GCM10027289_16530 [Tsukamurella serpentis]
MSVEVPPADSADEPLPPVELAPAESPAEPPPVELAPVEAPAVPPPVAPPVVLLLEVPVEDAEEPPVAGADSVDDAGALTDGVVSAGFRTDVSAAADGVDGVDGVDTTGTVGSEPAAFSRAVAVAADETSTGAAWRP